MGANGWRSSRMRPPGSAPGSLGPVHGLVRRREQGLLVAGVVRVERDPDARPGDELVPLGRHGPPREGVDDLLRHDGGRAWPADGGQHDGELDECVAFVVPRQTHPLTC